MKSTGLYHLQVNVTPDHAGFYRDFFDWLGWDVVYTHDLAHGVRGPNGTYLWFESIASDAPNDRDGRGVNHIAIGATSIAAVDQAAAWLRDRGIEPLFETPRHRPEFAANIDAAYYQLMFESPDGLLFEFVWTGA